MRDALICQAQILVLLTALHNAGMLPGLGSRFIKDIGAHLFLAWSWSDHAEILVERGQLTEGRALAEGVYQFELR